MSLHMSYERKWTNNRDFVIVGEATQRWGSSVVPFVSLGVMSLDNVGPEANYERQVFQDLGTGFDGCAVLPIGRDWVLRLVSVTRLP